MASTDEVGGASCVPLTTGDKRINFKLFYLPQPPSAQGPPRSEHVPGSSWHPLGELAPPSPLSSDRASWARLAMSPGAGCVFLWVLNELHSCHLISMSSSSIG